MVRAVWSRRKKEAGKAACVDFFTGALLILALTVIFGMDGINSIQHEMLGFDEGYNATVALNFSRLGEYRVSYPENIVFYNRITTGAAVLLPAAWLYSLFGVSNLTTNIVPLIYGLLDIILLWGLLGRGFGKSRVRYTLSAALTAMLIIGDTLFGYISTHLIGETGAIFFLLLCFLFFSMYYEKKKIGYLMAAGAALAGAFLTKSSMIFFVVTIFGVVFIEAFITRTMSWKKAFAFPVGFGMGFLAMDMVKFFQLGGIMPYLRWWKAEWGNMLHQSSGVDVTYSMGDKLRSLGGLFGCSRGICLVMLALPVLLYAIHIVYYLCRKKLLFKERASGLLVGGLGGASLLVYFLLLGGKGLDYGRRLCVNSFFVRCMTAFFIGVLFLEAGKGLLSEGGKRKIRSLCAGMLAIALLALALVFPGSLMKTNITSYLTAKTEKDYDYQVLEEFIEEVNALPENAVLYCYQWWQEPNITLYTDREMTDLSKLKRWKVDRENGYFVLGRRYGFNLEKLAARFKMQLEKVDHIQVDYSRLYSYGCESLFSIYKIH